MSVDNIGGTIAMSCSVTTTGAITWYIFEVARRNGEGG